MIWLTSDWHFNHNREFIYKARGFDSVEAMIEPALEQVLAALRESGVEAIPREAIHD